VCTRACACVRFTHTFWRQGCCTNAGGVWACRNMRLLLLSSPLPCYGLRGAQDTHDSMLLPSPAAAYPPTPLRQRAPPLASHALHPCLRPLLSMLANIGNGSTVHSAHCMSKAHSAQCTSKAGTPHPCQAESWPCTLHTACEPR